ncbi:MAG: DUF503 domain-containing protein [Epsilonproteobacteria bacterium]|nr:DUF503 domain-containing protein [Campylobacterota bacterium]
MVLTNCIIHLELPFVSSLKGRRAFINKIKDKMKNLNLSILDISSSYSKEIDLAIVFLSSNSKASAKYRQKIEELIYKIVPQAIIEFDCEEI